jgi:hypothetical protein
MQAVKGANVVMSHDSSCKGWISACKNWDIVNPVSTAAKAPAAAADNDDGPKVSRRMMRKLRAGSRV